MMIRSSLRAYLPAVLRQWWTYLGIGSGLIGYLLDFFTDLKISPLVWVAVFAACLVIAQFLAYHEVRVSLGLRDRELQIPQWAMYACNISNDGSWLTVRLLGDAPKRRLDTTRYQELVTAIDQHFGLSEDTRKVESYADLLRVTVPKLDGVAPEFVLRLSPGQHGVLCIQCRTQSDPLPLCWLLQQLDQMMAFLMSDTSEAVVSRKRREYMLCLSEWPAGGIDAGNLVTAHRLSHNSVPGSRTVGIYKLAKNDRDGWGAIRGFIATVLANAGYTEFEPTLGTVTRYSLATAADNANAPLPPATQQPAP